MTQAIPVPSDQEVTRMLNAFQRDGRAMLEQLLPVLRHKSLYPDAFVDGWGDARGGRGSASTVRLMDPKWLRRDDRTKTLAHVRLALDDRGAWVASVAATGAMPVLSAWPPPAAESDWWAAQREHIRARVSEYRQAGAR